MEIAKQVILDTNNPWMLGIEVYEVGKNLARIFKVKQKHLIYTRRDWKVYMREKGIIRMPMISVNIGEALKLLQHYLREVAECQQVLEHNTSNILDNLINQL